MLTTEQVPERFLGVINEQISRFEKKPSIQVVNSIPDTNEIPLNREHWLRIPDVICVYVDMLGSTRLSAETNDINTAGAYQLYTGCAVRLFHAFDSPYIDVRGDGAFALFNKNQVYRALAVAVSFKTYAREEFVPRIKELCDLDVGSHIGIDQKTVLVKRIGFRRAGLRTDRQNEVWAGKPVNMAAKLASLSENDEILASERYFEKLKNEYALKTCGCPNGVKVDLWCEKDLTADARFDFDKAFSLKSYWCKTHGSEYCEAILALDDQ